MKRHSKAGEPVHPHPQECLAEMLEYRARETDSELKKQLLKELVLKYSAAQRELVRLNKELSAKQMRLDQDLRAAAGIQRTLLPGKLPEMDKLDVAWKFIPCELIGGDIFNLLPLDDDHFAMYMIDVSGHGAPSALVTVSVSQALHLDGGYVLKKSAEQPFGQQIVSPADLLATLDEQYPMERFDMFFTIVYGIIDVKEGTFRYAKAGHPPPILLHSTDDLKVLEAAGPVIGMGGFAFAEKCQTISRGDKVVFYTDGIVEYENRQGDFYGKERFYQLLHEVREQPIGIILDRIIESLLEFGDDNPPQDDISLLGFEYRGP
jgi:phosphoserine phosphatase RsbU/P